MHRSLGNPCRDASGSPTLRRVTAIRSRQASNPLVVDTLLALALTGLSIIALLAGARDIGSYAPESIALLLLQTLPIAFRRIAPLPVLVVTLAATIVHALLATESLNTTLGSLIALFTVAERCDRRTSIVAGLAMGGSFAALLVTQAGVPASLGSLVQTELAVIVAWTLGTWSRERRAYIGTVEDRAARAEADREAQARLAVAAERERIARELHDVVTHHVSVIVIQAGAARRALELRPADAREAIDAIDTTGRLALGDMRRMLGILGSGPTAAAGADEGDPETAALAPMPGLDQLGALIESVRAAGLPVELSIEGQSRRLDPGCRALGVPDHPGGAHEHAEACTRRARDGQRPLRPRRAGGAHRRCGRDRAERRGGSRRRRARAHRHARAGRDVRWVVRGRTCVGRFPRGGAAAARSGDSDPMTPIRVLLVDDQLLVRTGFRMILKDEADIEVVGEATDGSAALDAARSLRPHVVVMDIRMPVMDGVEATRRLVSDPDVTARVLVLTTFDADEYVLEALRAGASGFLLKDVAPDDFAAAIRTIAAGDSLLAPSVTRRLLDRFRDRLPGPSDPRHARLSDLTERELEVLKLMARGLSNREIADELVLAEPTVKTHVSHVLLKLDLRDRAQAVVLAYEVGLVRPGSPTD